MKKNYLLFLTFLGSITFGQIIPDLSESQITPPIIQSNTVESIFTDLDKSKIPTGFLSDAAVEFSDLLKYNGSITDSSYVNSKIVIDIYNTITMSRLSSTAQLTKTPNQFTSAWKVAQNTLDVIPLGGVFFEYSSYSDNTQLSAKNGSISDKLIISNNKVQDKYINNVWVNPYQKNNVFAIAPSLTKFNKHKFKIILPENLFLSNNSASVQKIEYRLADDKPYQLLSKNKQIDVNYTSEGIYRWTFKITLNTGQIFYSQNKFEITGNLDKYTDITNIASKGSNLDQYSKKVILTNPNNILSQRATLYFKLAPGNTTIRKPLIVAEGFDMGRILTPNVEGGLTDIDDFIESTEDGGWNFYDNINSYDLIYVDWYNGVDYIQNNAVLLQKAIEYINSIKEGNTKNVIIGQSMGGLVTRYALKDMEDKGINHDTELFISHDAPHLGANIPLGIQYMLRNISNTYIKAPLLSQIGEVIVPIFNQGVSVNEIFTLTDTPAARQMLMNYVDKSYQINNTIHNNWQNELKAKGYPQQTRNVAISNGSECGTDQTLDTLLTLNKTTGNQHLFSDILGSLLGVAMDRLDMILISLLPGNSKYVFDFMVNPMTKLDENKQLYRGNITYKKKILWTIPANVTLLSGNRNQPAGVFPIDKYGGGKFSLLQDALPPFLSNDMKVNSFGFIPTPSALDIYSGNKTLEESDFQKTYSPVDDASIVPFSNFVIERMGHNQGHISFSPRNSEFIINQLSSDIYLRNTKITTSYLCGNKIKIGGDDLSCSLNKLTYTTGFAPYINWSVLEGNDLIDIISSTNQPQISLKPKTENSAGFVKLQAYLYGDGESNTVTKNIWLGKPEIWIELEPNMPNSINLAKGYLIAPNKETQKIDLVQWKTRSATSGGSISAADNSYVVNGRGNGNAWVVNATVSATNLCGKTDFDFLITPPAAPSCDNYKLVQTTPNTYSVYRIEPEQPCISNKNGSYTTGNNTQNSFKGQEMYHIIVANSLGTILIDDISSGIDLNNFPNGSYFVKILKENDVIITSTLIKK